jgi:SAM-dependent methyltransferase
MKKIIKKLLNKFNSKKKLTAKEQRHKLVGRAHLWKMKQQFQIDFLKSQGLKSTDTFLDVGCGTLRGGIPIIRFLDDNKYVGIDVRSEVIDEANKELKQEDLVFKNPELIHFDDFENLNIDREFDVVFAFAVLIHLSDDIAKKCFNFIGNHISENGVFYANVNIIQKEDMNWQGFPVVFRSVEFYENLAKNANLKLEVLDQLKNLGHITNKLGDEQFMLKFTKI